jgi:hypothetical protein
MPMLDDFASKDAVFIPTFNTFETLPLVGFLCAMHLVDNNEMIWRLVKYNEADAWKQTNLTRSEKLALLFNGVGNQNDFRIFIDEGQIDVWTQQACVLRIFPIEIFPENQVMADLYIAFQVLSYYEINHLTNYQTRVDTMIAEIAKTFNGTIIDGVGMLSFDRSAFPRCKMAQYGIKPFLGKMIVMGVSYTTDVNNV